MNLAMVILTALSVIVSIIALCISYNAAQKGNTLANAANELTQMANDMQKGQTDMQKGQVEMQIREMISVARNRYEDMAIQLKSDTENEIYVAAIDSAQENLLNAYDEACAKYLDAKVDRERFKKLYHDEIRQIVTAEGFAEKYREPQTKFHATNKVYKEWNNLED